MLYTGNANKFIWLLICPLLLVFHITFLIWSESSGQQSYWNRYSNAHQKNIANLKSIDGFILGGSNGQGLSAKIMSEKLNQQWYNFSLSSEGGSDQNYWHIIQNSISKEQRAKVKNIVYSSGTPLNDYGARNRNSYFFKIISSPESLILPYRSLASHIKEYFAGEGMINLDSLGDKKFDSSSCINNNLTLIPYASKSNEIYLTKWVLSQLNTINNLFPNAKISFVIPSSYYLSDETKNSKLIFNVINENITDFDLNHDTKVALVKQDSYPSIEMLCNDSLHANDIGRVWRTNNLLGIITAE